MVLGPRTNAVGPWLRPCDGKDIAWDEERDLCCMGLALRVSLVDPGLGICCCHPGERRQAWLIHALDCETDNKERTLGSQLPTDRLSYNPFPNRQDPTVIDAPAPRPDQLPMGASRNTWPNIVNNKVPASSASGHTADLSQFPALYLKPYTPIKAIPTWKIHCFSWCTLAYHPGHVGCSWREREKERLED